MSCALGPLVWAPLSELMGRRLPLLIGMFGFRCVSRVINDVVLNFALLRNNVKGGWMHESSVSAPYRTTLPFYFVCLIISVHTANSTGNDRSSIFSIAVAVAKDYQTVMLSRFFSSLFSASPLAVVPACFRGPVQQQRPGWQLQSLLWQCSWDLSLLPLSEASSR